MFNTNVISQISLYQRMTIINIETKLKKKKIITLVVRRFDWHGLTPFLSGDKKRERVGQLRIHEALTIAVQDV